MSGIALSMEAFVYRASIDCPVLMLAESIGDGPMLDALVAGAELLSGEKSLALLERGTPGK
jgi:hypothetical protein